MILVPRQAELYGRDARNMRARDVGIYLPIWAVFPDLEPTERLLVELLSTLGREETIMQCAYINILVSGEGDYENKSRQEQAISRLCTSGQQAKINDFAKQRGAGLPIVFFSGQLRELMRWAARHCAVSSKKSSNYDDATVRERLFKAALIASEVWSRRVYGDSLVLNDSISVVRRRALGAFRKGIEETGQAPHLGVAIGRGLTLFTEYLPRRFPKFAEEFERATGLTIRQYLGCATVISLYMMQRKADGPVFNRDTVASATARPQLYPLFLDLVSQSAEELERSFWSDFGTQGYRALREKPIMIGRAGQGIILDPAFFVECVSIGPLFAVVRRVGEIAFTKFGDAFEDYASDILRRMYPSRPFLVDRVSFGLEGSDKAGRNFKIDAVAHGVDASAVAEIKAVFLPERAISSRDPDAFIRAILSKYGASAAKGERDKGVAQLARSVGAIARGEWDGPKNEFKGVKVLYPLLIVHDSRLDAPALGHFLEIEFRKLLGPVPNKIRVAPLTIMTIQDLENLERSVEAFSLIDLLRDYERECPDRMRSLHNHIVFSHYGRKILPSAQLIDRSIAMLDVMQTELFPDATLPDTSWRQTLR